METTKKLTKKQILERDKQEAFDFLRAYKGCKIYCNVVSVSRSGMSRKMRFFAMKDNHMQSLTYWIAQLLEYPNDGWNWLRADGCGMDMRFAVISNLNYKMATMESGKTIQELLLSKEYGEHIYDKAFFNANDIGNV